MASMLVILSKALVTFAAAGAAARNNYVWNNAEEAPPHTAGLWLGIGLCLVLIVLVSAGIRYQRHRRIRLASVLPEDPFAVDAMRACVSLFCGLEPAWKSRDRIGLRRLVAPPMMAGWRRRLDRAPVSEQLVDGPLVFEYMGAANPSPGADRRAVVRVEGRLRAPSKQVAISRRQRNWLLGLAGAILMASFVGIALAPATKLRNSRPTSILVRGGIPLRGTRLLTYRRGAWIDVTVRSDVADEVYLQGYNVYRPVAPGLPAHLRLRASIEGSYPIQLEQRDETVAQVVVQP